MPHSQCRPERACMSEDSQPKSLSQEGSQEDIPAGEDPPARTDEAASDPAQAGEEQITEPSSEIEPDLQDTHSQAVGPLDILSAHVPPEAVRQPPPQPTVAA